MCPVRFVGCHPSRSSCGRSGRCARMLRCRYPRFKITEPGVPWEQWKADMTDMFQSKLMTTPAQVGPHSLLLPDEPLAKPACPPVSVSGRMPVGERSPGLISCITLSMPIAQAVGSAVFCLSEVAQGTSECLDQMCDSNADNDKDLQYTQPTQLTGMRGLCAGGVEGLLAVALQRRHGHLQRHRRVPQGGPLARQVRAGVRGRVLVRAPPHPLGCPGLHVGTPWRLWAWCDMRPVSAQLHATGLFPTRHAAGCGARANPAPAS